MKSFWSKVKVGEKEDCWNWIGAKSANGYGAIRINGKMKGAHRVSWELNNSEIPEGQCVLHKCDNPSCVNPHHLFLGTGTDNMRDRSIKGRCNVPSGEKCHLSKLTESMVKEIRKLRANRSESVISIAKRYGIVRSHVYHITSYPRRAWK